jgi:hypothetical protein
MRDGVLMLYGEHAAIAHVDSEWAKSLRVKDIF